MSDVELRVLIPVKEYRLLKKASHEHKKCLKNVAISKGEGSDQPTCHGDKKSDPKIGTYDQVSKDCPNKFNANDNYDHSVNIVPKELIAEKSPTVKVHPNEKETRKLSSDVILSQLKPKFRSKGRQLLNILAISNDLSYDNNGMVTIFGRDVPGMYSRAKMI